ncbi:MAG: insulinase family protein [Barnesiella sp.]|nr:insulinase family protein [Barnesiella sp.]
MTQHPDRTKEPAVRAFDTLRMPEPTLTKLPNGIELYALNAGDQPLNRITVSYASGLMEAVIPDALSLAAQLLREGTESYTGSQVSETLDFHGAWLKCDAGSHDTTVSLWSLNKSTVNLLPLLKEILTSPAFPEKEFATLRDKHKARYLLSQKNVGYMAAQIDKKNVFGENHPMSRILNAEEIESLTTDDVRAAYKQAFSTAPRVFVTGEITDLLPEIIEFFSEFEFADSSHPAQNILPMRPVAAGTVATCNVDSEHQAALAVSIPAIDRSHPDYIPLRLVVMALGGYFGSRLMANIREDKGYTYGINGNLLGYREGGVVSIMTNTAPQYVDSVISEIRHELNRLREEPMDEEELAIVRNNAMSSLAAILDTPFSIMDHHISHFHTGTPDDYFNRQLEAIKSLSSNQIMELAQKYLDPQRMIISIARPTAESAAAGE